jgi:hypothetical protein
MLQMEKDIFVGPNRVVNMAIVLFLKLSLGKKTHKRRLKWFIKL